MNIQENTKIVELINSSWRDKLTEWQAWYIGDPGSLRDYYASRPRDVRFWGSIPHTKRAVHLPIASDIAAMNSDMLFSEPITWEEPVKMKAKDSVRLEEIYEQNGMQATLVEAAELCSAYGGVYLKWDIDESIADVPLMGTAIPLIAMPEFVRGRLHGVSFITDTYIEKGGYYRLVEHRENEKESLRVWYELFKGTQDSIGTRVDLKTFKHTEELVEATYGMPGLGCVYIPNIRPNKYSIGSAEGMSDFGRSGLISLMDSLDETYTSLMRDVRLGAAHIFIDSELTKDGNFNVFEEMFIKLDLGDLRTTAEKYKPIDYNQFEIRVDDHLKLADNLIRRIIASAGYSAQTYLSDLTGKAESGAALRQRERRSMLTRMKKSHYWQHGLSQFLYQGQFIDKQDFSGISTPTFITVLLEDSIIPDLRDTAESVRALSQAEAISTYTKVKLTQPDLTDEAVEEEVGRILNESGKFVPEEPV